MPDPNDESKISPGAMKAAKQVDLLLVLERRKRRHRKLAYREYLPKTVREEHRLLYLSYEQHFNEVKQEIIDTATNLTAKEEALRVSLEAMREADAHLTTYWASLGSPEDDPVWMALQQLHAALEQAEKALKP